MLRTGLPKNPPGLPPGQYGSKLAVQVGHIIHRHNKPSKQLNSIQEQQMILHNIIQYSSMTDEQAAG